MLSSLIQTLLSVPVSHRIGRLSGSRTFYSYISYVFINTISPSITVGREYRNHTSTLPRRIPYLYLIFIHYILLYVIIQEDCLSYKVTIIFLFGMLPCLIYLHSLLLQLLQQSQPHNSMM